MKRPLPRILIFHISAVILFLTAGCSGSPHPDNLEPVIELFDADDVTRTAAIISAQIIDRGSTPLSYVRFHYGTSPSNIDRHASPDSDSDPSRPTLHLGELSPGTTYFWYVEAGTATAVIRSGTRQFSTLPNVCPVISRPLSLSSGPVGLIISFDIIDDGGEPVLEAGCDVTDNASASTRRILLPSDRLSVGTHRLYITGLSVSTTYVITPFASNSVGESRGEALSHTTAGNIVMSEAGSLSLLFDLSKGVDSESLSISGCMNGDDFRFLRHLLGASESFGGSQVPSALTDVDLFDVSVVWGGSPYDGSRYTSPDELTTGLFADCVRLRHIVLPASARVMARDAVARCSSLTSISIPASVSRLLPSSGCTALQSIEVSASNPNYSSVDGVLFNADASDVIWFPLAKSGPYTLPPSVTAIGENTFFGTSITSLEIPASVTSIARGAFAGSSLTEISLPDNLTNISEAMFQNCASLSTVRLGRATQFIGNYAFDGTPLSHLYVAAATPPFVSSDAFYNRDISITAGCTLHIPEGTLPIYRNHAEWSKFTKIEEYY
ncbi:MAG: leucine-rich repeat domain-containing protein [Muribaculaceae bacterium]|nr:leucine-rich repeat domain-containing protein [Muribaculaceae bacterium]